MRSLADLLRIKEQNERIGVYKPFQYNEAQILHKHYMQLCKLQMSKCTMPIYNSCGTKIANGYERIVVGDYGAYIEISPSDMVRENIRIRPSETYRMTDKYKDRVKYFWLETKDECCTKIYFQKRTVAYADYKPEMCYVAPFDVTLKCEN